MIKNAPEPQKTEIFEKSSWVRAKIAGLFHPKINLGDNISKRQLLGRITDPYGNETVKVVSNYNGKVIGLNYNPVVHKGDAILHIANRA